MAGPGLPVESGPLMPPATPATTQCGRCHRAATIPSYARRIGSLLCPRPNAHANTDAKPATHAARDAAAATRSGAARAGHLPPPAQPRARPDRIERATV